MLAAVPDDDRVFKALADPTRRFLLDLLRRRDGRSLGELEAELSMTRFGVMKHLRVLELARLVVTRRDGRRKLHYLNAVPIRLVHDRWIDRFTEPWAADLARLKQTMEKTVEKVFEIYIKTTPERLWQALTDPALRQQYNFGVGVYSTWKAGAAWAARAEDFAVCEGEILEIDPPRRLVQSFRATWSDAVEREGTSRVTWEITAVGDSCRLLVVHDQLRDGANSELYGGYMMLLSGLKTLLETGQRLTTPASLRYTGA
jgi:uncharacterized protein YndB with AHSA1/START domain/DNA-binding transcriptional ArsR family regulator